MITHSMTLSVPGPDVRAAIFFEMKYTKNGVA